MNSNQNLTRIATAEELYAGLTKLAEHVVAFADLYVASIDANPAIKDQLIEKGADSGLLLRLELLGRKQIDPRLVFATKPGAERLMLCSISDQRRVLDEGIEILDQDEQTTRRFDILQLDASQAKQAIRNREVKSLAEQRTWIRKLKSKVPKAVNPESYRIFKDFVITPHGEKISKKTVLQWLVEMS